MTMIFAKYFILDISEKDSEIGYRPYPNLISFIKFNPYILHENDKKLKKIHLKVKTKQYSFDNSC